MRKFIVGITLLYTAVVVATLGFVSNGFREGLAFGESAIVTVLATSLPAVWLVAVLAWRRYSQWLTLLLALVVLGAGGYALKMHRDAYGEWLPALTSGEIETSGSATLSAHGRTLRYHLELHHPGSVAHREYLVVVQNGEERRIRLPLFGEARSGYVSPKTPGDWIILRPTDDPGVFIAETGRFLFVRKTFRVDLQTGKVTAAASLPMP